MTHIGVRPNSVKYPPTMEKEDQPRATDAETASTAVLPAMSETSDSTADRATSTEMGPATSSIESAEATPKSRFHKPPHVAMVLYAPSLERLH